MKAAFQWEERNISKLDTVNILEDAGYYGKSSTDKVERKCQDRDEDCILIRVVSVCLTKVTFEQRI